MTDDANTPPALTNPALEAATRVHGAFRGAWWGILATVAASVRFIAAVLTLVSDSSPVELYGPGGASAVDRLMIAGSSITLLAPVLIIVSLLVAPIERRPWAFIATGVWSMAILVTAVAAQRGIG